jgi:NAD-dependent DNA ligase
MPPKKAAPAGGDSLYVVVVNNTVNSIYATQKSAQEHADSINDESVASTTARIELHTLKGGSITLNAAKNEVKEEQDDEDEVKASKDKTKVTKKVKGEEDAEPKRAGKATKAATKTSKAKAIEASLPDHVNKLLHGSGSFLSGLAIVVTGVPPMLGRQNAERLVMNYGGKLAKSISKNTDYVVVGREAGPKKLEQIEDLGIEALDEDEFIQMLEEGGGAKRGTEDGDGPAAKRAKK